MSPDSSEVFVTGWSYVSAAAQYVYATIAYNGSTGGELWLKRYNGPVVKGADRATGLAVSPDGSKVFVTGKSPDVGNVNSSATIGYWVT